MKEEAKVRAVLLKGIDLSDKRVIRAALIEEGVPESKVDEVIHSMWEEYEKNQKDRYLAGLRSTSRYFLEREFLGPHIKQGVFNNEELAEEISAIHKFLGERTEKYGYAKGNPLMLCALFMTVIAQADQLAAHVEKNGLKKDNTSVDFNFKAG